MNEITKIHLGRQPFTISVDAHKDLRAYLEAIEAQTGAQSDVLKEVEVRMAELLSERGISGDKVILGEDVAFLKEQLGEPRDFKEDGDEPEAGAQPSNDPHVQKRLFRDTEHGMIAGVSSGLATYLGIDVVIVRLIFVLITIMAGWGILLYIILWLIVPEAKTTSERLQMRGKAVTVDSLKEIVDRADVPGASRRVQKVVGPAAERIGKIVLAIVGIGFIVFGALTFFGGMVGGLYTVLYREDILQGTSFVASASDYAFVGSVIAITAVVGLFAVLIGSALVRRKWQLPGWVTAGCLGVFFVAVTIATVMAPGFVSKAQDYREAATQTQIRQLAPFSDVKVVGSGNQYVRYEYAPNDKYAVELRYLGKANLSSVKTDIQNTTLVVDTRGYDDNADCKALCLVPTHDMQITIYAPQLKTLTTQGDNVGLIVSRPLKQQNIVAETLGESWISFSNIAAGSATVTDRTNTGALKVTLDGLRPAATDDTVTVHATMVSLSRVSELSLDTDKQCWPPEDQISSPLVWLGERPERVTINGKATTDISELTKPGQHTNKKDAAYCVRFES